MFYTASNRASIINRVAIQQAKRRAVWKNIQRLNIKAVETRPTFQPFAH